jgi:hypothetical protein
VAGGEDHTATTLAHERHGFLVEALGARGSLGWRTSALLEGNRNGAYEYRFAAQLGHELRARDPCWVRWGDNAVRFLGSWRLNWDLRHRRGRRGVHGFPVATTKELRA